MVFSVKVENEWNNLISGLPPTSFIALIDGKNGGPSSYPCMIKIIETATINEKDEAVQSFIITFFYKEDALLLLNIKSEKELEGYSYAESETR